MPILQHLQGFRPGGRSLAGVLALAFALVLVAPVAGPVERGFDGGRPYAAGHRGVDLAAAPGTPVRAACGGPVVFAGRIGSSGGIVTLRCGPWRVTHMPLATISARGSVRRGAVIGTAARSRAHRGLHLGVRREGVPFGYVDPLRFLAGASGPAPLARARRPARRIVRPPPPGPPRRLVRAPRPRPARAPAQPFAPWPAWAGLALVLAGAGLRLRWKRRAVQRAAACSNPVARPEAR